MKAPLRTALLMLICIASARAFPKIGTITDGNSLLNACQWVEKDSSEESNDLLTENFICMAYLKGVTEGFVAAHPDNG